jgi:hypothetical protein
MTKPQETMLDLLQKLSGATNSMLEQVIILGDQLEFNSRFQIIDTQVSHERKLIGCALCEAGIPLVPLTKMRP